MGHKYLFIVSIGFLLSLYGMEEDDAVSAEATRECHRLVYEISNKDYVYIAADLFGVQYNKKPSWFTPTLSRQKKAEQRIRAENVNSHLLLNAFKERLEKLLENAPGATIQGSFNKKVLRIVISLSMPLDCRPFDAIANDYRDVIFQLIHADFSHSRHQVPLDEEDE